MNGIVNLNKPRHRTSRDAVDRVKGLVRPAKVGHAGTLDPLATGVLVVCIGRATRLIPYLHEMSKEYQAVFRLGCSSASDDVETQIVELADSPRPTREQIDAARARFIGRIEQRPPMFSAVKVDGRRAYKLARRGRQVELSTRTVTIDELAVVEFAYPRLELRIACGSGTYVRALGRDLARAVGTSAVMTHLMRTRIGPFHLADAVDPETLDAESLARGLQPPLAAVEDLPRVLLTDSELAEIPPGGLVGPFSADRIQWRPQERRDCADFIPACTTPCRPDWGDPSAVAAPPYAALDGAGRLAAILKPAPGGRLKPSPNFLQPD